MTKRDAAAASQDEGPTGSLPTRIEGRIVARRYRLLRQIAKGGMGTVFEAEHLITKKRVALKCFHPHFAGDDAAQQRFLREAQAPAEIAHPHIVDITDAGTDPQDGSLFLCMELLQGCSLRDYFEQDAPSRRAALARLVEVLDPLAAAHAKRFVHRDLKPENVFVVQNEAAGGADRPSIKLLDFGITRRLNADSMTGSGIAMGTARYMSPEQAQSARSVTAAADAWSMGVMLYEVTTGAPPFVAEGSLNLLMSIAFKPHRPVLEAEPSVPAPLVGLIDACLEKEPARRPADARELKQRLVGALEQCPAAWLDAPLSRCPTPEQVSSGVQYRATQPASSSHSGPGRLRTRRSRVVAALSVVTALAMVGAWFAFRSVPEGAASEGSVAEPLPSVSTKPPGVSLPASAAQDTASFTVRVAASPQVAEIWLDDVQRPNPLQLDLPKDGRPHRLVVRAEGFREHALLFVDTPPPDHIKLQPLAEPQAAVDTPRKARVRRSTARRGRPPQAGPLDRVFEPVSTRSGDEKPTVVGDQTAEPVRYGPNRAPVIR